MPEVVSSFFDKGASWIVGLAIVVLAYLFSQFLSMKVKSYVESHTGDEDVRKQETIVTVSRVTTVTIMSLAILVALDIVGILGNLGWLLGSIGLGLGFGFKNVLSNFVAGIGILLQDKTNIGDIVEIGGFLGKIEEIGMRTTVLRQLDGIEIIIPNADFYQKPVSVYTANPFRRLKVTMGVGYNTDFTLAESIARDLLDKRPDVEKKPEPLFLISSIDTSTVRIDLKFWVKSDLPWWNIESEVLKDWFTKSMEAGIDITHPITTLRVDEKSSALLSDFVKTKVKDMSA